jgi:ribose/xylose/arabinose/galactoside ABC-type transport system permease subunit
MTMSFEDGTQTGPAGRSLGVSSGEFRAVQRDTATFEAVPALVAAPGRQEPAPAAQPNLHYVFDDPNDGEPGRDRMLVHLLWEAILAVGVVAAGFALVKARPGALGGDSLRDLVLTASLVGLLGLASAVSLRAAVPNLAVGAVAILASAWIGQHAHGSFGGVTATALGLCAALGLVQGLFVVGLHVPAWAASLGVVVAVTGWTTTQRAISLDLGYDPGADAWLWFVCVATASILASVIGVAGGIRRGFGRYRSVADPARRRTPVAALIAVAATIVSTVIAGLAGALYATRMGPGLNLETDGRQEVIILTAIAFGTALLGGTSAFGRRSGIFGTVVAACLVSVMLEWVSSAHPGWSIELVLAVPIVVGLAVTRLVERFGRPVLLPPEEEESWIPKAHSPASGTAPSAPWRPGPLWSDEGWGNPPR